MPSVRLPQTKHEIQAAAANIVAAVHAPHIFDDQGVHARYKGGEDKANAELMERIEFWLRKMSKLGAMENKDLVMQAQLTLASTCDDLKRFGGKRIALILARGSWRHQASGRY